MWAQKPWGPLLWKSLFYGVPSNHAALKPRKCSRSAYWGLLTREKTDVPYGVLSCKSEKALKIQNCKKMSLEHSWKPTLMITFVTSCRKEAMLNQTGWPCIRVICCCSCSGSTAVFSWNQWAQQRPGEECAPKRFPLPEKNAWFDKLLDVHQNLTEGGHEPVWQSVVPKSTVAFIPIIYFHLSFSKPSLIKLNCHAVTH